MRVASAGELREKVTQETFCYSKGTSRVISAYVEIKLVDPPTRSTAQQIYFL